jgi:hypothetical protein
LRNGTDSKARRSKILFSSGALRTAFGWKAKHLFEIELFPKTL